MSLKLLCPFFICLLLSCSTKETRLPGTAVAKKDILKMITDNGLNVKKYDNIIIIPNVGCGSCISDAQASFMKNYSNLNTLYIFTAIEDIKLFRNIFPVKMLANKNIIIDTANVMSSFGFKSIYPTETTISDSDTLNMKIFENQND